MSRFVLNDNNTVDPASETVLIDGILSTAAYHNAGDLHVAKDGYLYVSTGDGGCDYVGTSAVPGGSGCGGDNNASRDRNVLNGKILRITTSGGIPTDNPFQGDGTARCNVHPAGPGLTCQEAYAVGLRNPFRIAFDPNAATTSFRINDVGQNVWEEIDRGVRGADYGWNTREGHCQRTNSETNCGLKPTPFGFTDPIYDYGHSSGCGSITGGAFVPNNAWPAAYNGAYLFADYVCGKIFALSATNVRTDFVTNLGASSAVALAFGPDGPGQSLYYADYRNSGEIRKIKYTGSVNRPPSATMTATPTAGAAPLAVNFSGAGSADPDGNALTYSWNYGDGTAATPFTSSVTAAHTYTRAGDFTARLTVRDTGGLTGTASTVVHPGDAAPVVTITAPTAAQLFTVGGTYTLTGTATDAEDGTLPAAALSWTVLRHHAQHTHPYLSPTKGNNIPLVGPVPEDLAAAANSFLEIQLTATDSHGVSTTVTRNFNPLKVPVTLASTPTGRTLTANGNTFAGPTTVTSWAGYRLTVGASTQTDASGTSYSFSRWSDNGAATHIFTTPSSPVTLTATFTATTATVPTIPTAFSVNPTTATSATMTWSAPANAGGRPVTGYRVSRDNTDSAGTGAFTTVIPATSTTYTMSRLVAGRTYNLSVQAINAVGTSPVIGGGVIVGTSAVPAPTTFTVAQAGATAATVTWQPPAVPAGTTITGYTVLRNGTDSAGTGPFSTTVGPTVRTFTMRLLVPGRSYTLSVRPMTAAGTGNTARGAVLIR